MSVRLANLSDEGLHPKSFSLVNKDGAVSTVWRYKSWEPFTWHFRVQRGDKVFSGITFTRWGAKTEAARYADGTWGRDD